MTDFKHCNGCQTYTTCLEQGCGQVREIRASVDDDDGLERMLRQELANLHRGYLEQARPIINQLARLEAMKPPPPMWITGAQWAMLKPGVMEAITGKPEPAPENPGERMRRLEHERHQLLHLLRMVRSAAPDYLATQIDGILGGMKP